MKLFAKGKGEAAPAQGPSFSPVDRTNLLGLLDQIVNGGQSGVLELHEPRGNWIYAFQAGALTHASGGRVRGARQAFDLLWEFQAGEFMFRPGVDPSLAGNLYIDKNRLLDLLRRSQAVLQGPSAPYIPPDQMRPIAPVQRPYSPPSPAQMPPAWQPGMQQPQAPGWPAVQPVPGQPGFPQAQPGAPTGWPPAYPQQMAGPGQPYPPAPGQQPYAPAQQPYPPAQQQPFQPPVQPAQQPLPPQAYPPVRGNVRPPAPPAPTYPGYAPQAPMPPAQPLPQQMTPQAPYPVQPQAMPSQPMPQVQPMPPQAPAFASQPPMPPAAPARPAPTPSFSVPPMPIPKKAQQVPAYQPPAAAPVPPSTPEPAKAAPPKDDLAALRASLVAQAPAVKPAPAANWGVRTTGGTVTPAPAVVDPKTKGKGKEKGKAKDKKKGDSRLMAAIKLQLIKFLLWACERRYSPDDHWTLKDAFEVSTMELRDQFFGAFSQTLASTKRSKRADDDMDDMAAGRMRGRARRH